MQRKRLVLQVVALLVAGVVAVLLLLKWSTPPAAPGTPPAAPPRTSAPAIEAPLMITASAVRITGAGEVIVGGIDPNGAESGVLKTDAAAAQAEIDALVAAGSAEVLARPRMVVLSGQPARFIIGSVPVPGASPPTRRSLELDVIATAYADGAADLKAAILNKDVSGELSIFLDDLGVPIGERRVEGDLHIPSGSWAYLIRPLRDGSVLLVLLEVQVQLPEPGDDAEGR